MYIHASIYTIYMYKCRDSVRKGALWKGNYWYMYENIMLFPCYEIKSC